MFPIAVIGSIGLTSSSVRSWLDSIVIKLIQNQTALLRVLAGTKSPWTTAITSLGGKVRGRVAPRVGIVLGIFSVSLSIW